MEFRFRAVDVDRPHLATDTAPSHPPISGPIDDHVREAIQRQTEKEQLRQQITVAETTTRREVLAEVVHEMAIEREMAIRKVAETTGLPLTRWINQNMNPLMYTVVTSPMIPEATATSNQKKLIVLNRTDHIAVNLLAEDAKTDLERTKRKADGVERVLNKTSLWKRLKSKAAAMETGETPSSKIPCLGELGSGKQVECNDKSKYKFWCEDCGVGAYSEKVMRDHKLGKKHKAVVTPPDDITTSITTAPAIKVPQSEAITVLENATVQNQKLDEVAEKESIKKTKGDKKKTVILRCETCNIQTNSEQVMEAHRHGKKHKALLEKQHNRPLAVLNTKLLTDPVRLDADPGDNKSVGLAVDHSKGKVYCLD